LKHEQAVKFWSVAEAIAEVTANNSWDLWMVCDI